MTKNELARRIVTELYGRSIYKTVASDHFAVVHKMRLKKVVLLDEYKMAVAARVSRFGGAWNDDIQENL